MQKWTSMLAILIGFLSQTAFSQNTVPLDSNKSWAMYQSELSRLWKIQNEFLERKDNPNNDQLFNQILFLKDSYEVEKIPILSKAFLQKIPASLDLAEKSRHLYFQMASQLSPEHYSNDYFLCNFHVDTTEWPLAIKYCFQGLKKELSNPSEHLIFLSKISYQILWTIIALVVFYLVFYLYKFFSFMMQYYSSNFYWISPIAFSFLMLAACVLIFFSFGWLFVFALGYIFLWRFPSVKEKVLMFVLLCLVMAMPFTFIAPALGTRYHKSILFDLFNAESSLQPQRYVDRIESYVSTHPKESYALFTLGTLKTKSGEIENAKTYFEQSQIIQPLFMKTKLNLANLEYQLGDSETAKQDYKKLIQQKPDLMPAYLNLSQIYTHESQYLEGQQYLDKAKQIDEVEFKHLTKTLHNREGSVKLIFEELSLNDVSEQIYDLGDSFKVYFRQFFSHYFPKYSPKLFYITLLFAMITAIVFQIVDNARSFFMLFATREKNIENLTLVQLKEFPKAYKRYARKLEIRDKIESLIGHLIPGAWAFMNEKIFQSFVIASLFFFFLVSMIYEMTSFHTDYHFPWMFVYTTFVILIFLINFTLVKVQIHGKKKNKE